MVRDEWLRPGPFPDSVSSRDERLVRFCRCACWRPPRARQHMQAASTMPRSRPHPPASAACSFAPSSAIIAVLCEVFACSDGQ